MEKTYGLYIHIPFCAQKCYYCDFASYSGKEKLVEPYLEALDQEIRLKTQGKRFDTIFIGGGTPTYLSAEQLQRLGQSLAGVERTPDCEISMECNPGNLTEAKVPAIQTMGVNRLSIGLQSSNDQILLDIGRIHTFREFRDNYLMLRQAGFGNINVDLIYGLPGENLRILEKTLQDVLSLSPDHISCYSLIIEEFTPFYYRNQRRELKLPDEDLERQMNEVILRRMSEEGYERYEISNYARPGKECRHNIRYWEGRDYVGCGTSAHEYVDGIRQENIRTVEGYLRMMKEEGTAAVRIHPNTPEEDMEEYIFMGMRMRQGIDKARFQERFHVSLDTLFEEPMERFTQLGLLEDTPAYLRFTEKGIEFSNTVLSEFLLST